MRLRSVLGGVAAGVGLWSATEYVVHRWAMHGRRGTNPASAEHLDHHARPERTFALALDRRLVLKLASAPVVAAPVAALAGPVAGLSTGVAFAASYAGYTHTHHVIHHVAPRGAWSREVRKRHLAHHFATPKRNFGVTSAWCDVVARTAHTPERITVPRRLAPVWMVDTTGALKPQYAPDYVLAGRTRRLVADADATRALADQIPELD